jgi:flagellar basal body P-ring formation protein FlgA
MKSLLLILLLLGYCNPALALEISFKQNVQVVDALVRLGDVAQCSEETPLAEALASQPIGQAPPPGEHTLFIAQNIKTAILASNKSLTDSLTWSGSATINITREGTVIASDRIGEIIAEFLDANKGNLPNAALRFIPQTLPLPFTLPKGNLAVDVIPSNPAILSSSSISLIFKVDDRVVKNMSVRGKIEALAQVVAAAESLRKGLILGPQHLHMVEMDISDIASPELDPQNLLGMQLTRAIAAGAPITGANVESLPVVRRGQKVKMVIESGILHLTATGLAHSDGKLDQMIKIQNINSSKTVHGRVTGPGIVEVLL